MANPVSAIIRSAPQVAALALALLTAGCQTAAQTAAPVSRIADSELRDLTEAEKKLIGPALAKGLKDPDSAKFSWGKVPKQMPPAEFYYCGMVNAKNSYGGYVGEKPFVAMFFVLNNKILSGSIIGMGSNAIATSVVEKTCTEHGLDPYRAV